jgi:DNA polymerase-1
MQLGDCKNDKTAVVIDGYSYIFRSFYSVPSLIAANGLNVNAVFGFFNHIFGLIAVLKPTFVYIALDSKGIGFRDELYGDYKANRASCPDELKHQFDIIKNGIIACGLYPIFKHGTEADDIIASIAKFNKELGVQSIICSKDKDLMQLVENKFTYLYEDKQKIFIDEDFVFAKFGVAPKYIADYLALVGDSSDNIPGAKNIGPKKAAALIAKFGSVEQIYQNIEEIEQSVKTLLLQSRQSVELSKQLTSLAFIDDLVDDLSKANIANLNLDGGMSFFDSLGMQSVKTRFKNLCSNLLLVKQSLPDKANGAKSSQLSNPHSSLQDCEQGSLF